MMLTKEEYLRDPCGASSLPYWKAVSITVSKNMRIIHDKDFDSSILSAYEDTSYFRLIHSLKLLKKPVLPHGFQLCTGSDEALTAHINACYGAECVHVEELARWRQRAVYCDTLWLTLYDQSTGEIAASGIAELDRELGEGILEWIQVAPAYRRRGLGRFIVQELLWRMRKEARFVTVSGKCADISQPERLYRNCAFTGDDVWHILWKKRKYDQT